MNTPRYTLLRFAVTFAAALTLMGCAASQHKSGGQSTSLLAQVPDKSNARGSFDLVKVNSLTLRPIAFGRNVRVPVGTDKELTRLLSDAVTTDSEFSLIEDKGGNPDGVLVTTINRYVEREGSRVGANRPASVDFQMALVRRTDSKTLWEANYHYEDTALSDNLLKVRERAGSGWSTARELLAGGFRSAVRDLSARRRSAFAGE